MNCRPIVDLLWNSQKPFSPDFLIPDTLVYDQAVIKYWLFTAKDGTIKKKHHSSVTKQKLRQKFSKGNQRTGIYAVLYFQSHEDIYGDIEVPKNTRGTVYFDDNAFDALLNGVLQKVIDTGFLNNAVIQVNQTRYFTTFIKRTSKVQIMNKEQTLFQRMVTFDGTETSSLSNIVKGQLTFNLKRYMQQLSQRVQQMSDNRLVMRQFVGYWKKDIKGKIYFLYSPSTPIQEFGQVKKQQQLEKQQCVGCGKPINEDEAMQSVFRVLYKNPRTKQYQQAASRLKKKGQFSIQQPITVCTQCFLKNTNAGSGEQQQKTDQNILKIEQQPRRKTSNNISSKVQQKYKNQFIDRQKRQSRKGIKSQPAKTKRQSSEAFLPQLKTNKLKGIQPNMLSKRTLAKDLDGLLGRTQQDKVYAEEQLNIYKLRAQIQWLRTRIPYEGQIRLKVLQQIVDSCQ